MSENFDILSIEGALNLMPLLTRAKFAQLRKQGTGPKFALIGNQMKFQRETVVNWYADYERKLFSNSKIPTRQRRAVAKPAAKANGKGGKAKAAKSAEEMLA